MTPKQQECLDAIERLTVNGVSPSFDELRLHLGLASKSGVHRLVHDLAARGLITITSDRHRSIRVVSREAETVPFQRMAEAVMKHIAVASGLNRKISIGSVRRAMVDGFKTGAA